MNAPVERLLITGGAGFIGSNLAELATASGVAVTIVDDLSVGSLENLKGIDCRFVKGDFRDTDLISRLVSEVDGVVHLAAQTGVPGSLLDPHRDCEINVVGTLSVLEACRIAQEERGSPIRFVFASSNAPLGRQPPPAQEDKAPLPMSPYGASKLAGEAYCMAYFGSWGLPTVTLRFANVYGPRSAHKESVVAKFFRDALAGELLVDGDGGQTRDFIYVEDLCGAVMAALSTPSVGEVFHIATGVETSISELAERMVRLMGAEVSVDYGPERQGDIRRNYSAIEKANRLLGWAPEVSLDDGLELSWAWFGDVFERERLANLGSGGG